MREVDREVAKWAEQLLDMMESYPSAQVSLMKLPIP
jgi:hypothetical protein